MQLMFREKRHETTNIWTFIFVPQEPLKWIAGQSIRLEIPGPYGTIEHRFSISSAPSNREVAITTRLNGSDYKDSLANLAPGDAAQGYAVEGDFVWRDSKLPHIFVAAGIGITPFHAMIAERIANDSSVPATLLYSGRDEPMLFAQELQEWQRNGSQLTVHTKKTRVSAEQVLGLPHARERIIYISGPSKMASALSTDLIAAGIAPAQITQDLLTGRLSEDG